MILQCGLHMILQTINRHCLISCRCVIQHNYARYTRHNYRKLSIRNSFHSGCFQGTKTKPNDTEHQESNHSEKELGQHDAAQMKQIVESATNAVIYNSVINADLHLGYKTRKIKTAKLNSRITKLKEEILEAENPVPVSLKYFIESVKTHSSDIQTDSAEKEAVVFPFKSFSTLNENGVSISGEEAIATRLNVNFSTDIADAVTAVEHGVQEDDEEVCEEEEEGETEELETWRLNYGTPDPSVPLSNVPCGGCGALLHCQDVGIPGYLPSDLFKGLSEIELRTQICQRCRFLQDHNVALNVRVDPNEYPKLMSHLRKKRALIILMVDLLDFPCSIWPGVFDIIGARNPICIVGNKVDLLPKDSPGYLDRVRRCLAAIVENAGVPKTNIKHVCLVSAKTGFGVEELVTKVQNAWSNKGDVYLIGCTNVGKSSLFNALLQSDMCKVKAADLVLRATTSPWPGTTLNLLKFPMMLPSGWRLYMRTKRLQSERQQKIEEQKLRKDRLRETRNPTYATLVGHIGRTFVKQPDSKAVSESMKDPFSCKGLKEPDPSENTFDPEDPAYVKGKWCYDTPGVVQPDQILTFLTAQELIKTLPRSLILPRTYTIRPSQSLFVAGLARVDVLSGPRFVRVTVFASEDLPISVVWTEGADAFYKEHLGTEVLGVPCGGGMERLANWPGLSGKDIKPIQGLGHKETAADIILSSTGWVSVTVKEGETCTLRAYTPEARGIYLRRPSLLPGAATLTGKRIRSFPAHQKSRLFVQ